MVRDYYKPKDIDDALAALAAPSAVALAGGTFLLAGSLRGGGPELGRVVDLFELLPRGISRAADSPVGSPAEAGTPAASGNPAAASAAGAGAGWLIGAGTTFQELIDTAEAPACLKAAALSMANRNTRNRATVGGNLGANKSCASLVPILLALGASVEYRVRGVPAARKPLEAWLAAPEGLVLNVIVPAQPAGSRVAALRASRTACDLATATAAVRYALEGGRVVGLRVAMGGFGPHAGLRPDLAALFEGKPLPPKAEIEAAAGPLLAAKADQRGSAEYKRARGATLLADALHDAEVLA
jgi:CO/xanthine dehydrogenase FAD-binding subunit